LQESSEINESFLQNLELGTQKQFSPDGTRARPSKIPQLRFPRETREYIHLCASIVNLFRLADFKPYYPEKFWILPEETL